MPLAETASTFNECVVMAAAIRDAADDGEKLSLIESQLQDITQVICDIYSRYRFETMVFANREQQFMPADVLCGFMTEAQKQSYGDGLDQDLMHPYMWVCKSHYYGPTFYNFPMPSAVSSPGACMPSMRPREPPTCPSIRSS